MDTSESIISTSSESSGSTKTTESKIIDPYDDINKLKFTSQETYYYKSIEKFLKKLDKKDIQKMADIIDGNGKSKISLRLLDWFVTSYANKYKTKYDIKIYNETERFTVHIGYKAQLKSFRKRYFDPFRRREKKFYYYYDKDDKSKRFYTTICQLNFFRWIYEYGILKYVEDHFDDIKNAMVKANKENKKRKEEKKKLKIEKKVKKKPTLPPPTSFEGRRIVVSFD